VNTLDPWYSALRWLLISALTGYAPGASPEEAGSVAAPDTAAIAGFDSLRGFLESRGWRVERAADGSILLIPLGETSEVPEQAAPVPPDLRRADDIDRLRDALAVHGWHVERGRGKSLLLIPASGAAPEEAATAAPPAWIYLTTSAEHMAQLLQILETYHWTLVPDHANTLRLVPPPQPQADATPASAADCAAKRRDVLVAAGVELPVNTRKEAWQISANWLWESGYRQLTVRTIREFYWLYLVTIVDDRPPYRPRGQLIIDKQTGQLLASF